MGPFSLKTLLVSVLTGVSIFGCLAPIKHEMTTEFPPAVLYVVGTTPAVDGRARFRQIFCQLLATEPDYQGHAGECEQFLLRFNDEPQPDDMPRSLPRQSPRYRVLIVSGFLNECFANIALPFEDAIESLNDRKHTIDILVVSGRSSSDSNATHIAESIKNLHLDDKEKLVLVGHSKGAVDILHFLVNYPQISQRVAAVVSVAGAINGSRLAVKLDDIYTDLARNFLSGRCDTGDDGALNSLQPAVRLSWLAANPLPQSIHYFSLAALTKRDHVNTLLKPSYDLLWTTSPRNDGLLLSIDQIIPGGTILGYANADHWSVVLPLEDKSFMISDTIRMPVKFPRRVLLQAMLVYVAEALEAKRK